MLAFLPFLLVMAGAGFVGSRFRPGAWYDALAKPAFNPPPWLFAPVWTVLYVLIAVAGFLVFRRGGRLSGTALSFWVAQALLNAAWSWIFFGLHRPGLALAEILVLLAVIVGFIVFAFPVDRAAAGLFVPYALWVSFATALNAAIWWLNRGVR